MPDNFRSLRIRKVNVGIEMSFRNEMFSNSASGARTLATPLVGGTRWAICQHVTEGGRGWALALLAIAAYLPAIAGAFVGDDWTIVAEPLIRRWDGIFSIWLSPAEMARELHYWPMVYSTFWLEHKLWGFHAAGYHAVNLLLHALNVLLVWRLLLRLEIAGAWLAAAVFAVHPVHVESVAWIIERKDLLSGLFYLCSVHVWLRHDESPELRRLVLCLGLFAAALLSKSIVVTMPAALLLLRWWRTGRVAWCDVGRLLPFFALAVGITAADLFFYWSRDNLGFEYSLLERVLIAARALWIYASQLAWPVSLPIFYLRWEVSASDLAGWFAFAAVCTILVALWGGRHRVGRGPLAAVAFFILTLSPVLGFVDFGFMGFSFVADRFQYLASIGLIALVSGGAMQLVATRHRKGKLVAAGIVLAVLATLSLLTWRQTEAYRDDLQYARHITTANPTHYFGQVLLSHQLVAVGQHREGLAVAREAVRLTGGQAGAGGDSLAAAYAAGVALTAGGRHVEAEEEFLRALAIRPKNGSVRLALAQVLMHQGRYGDALHVYRELTLSDPRNDLAYVGRGETLYRSGNFTAAMGSYRQALILARDPRTEVAVQRRLGETMHKIGKLDAAAEYLERSLALYPRDVLTLIARAAVEVDREAEAGRSSLEHNGDRNEPVGTKAREWLKQAREHIEAAIERDPDRAEARALLATVLHRLGEHRQAKFVLEKVLSADPNRPVQRQAQRLMGEILESQGHPDKAADRYRSALALYPMDVNALERLAAIHFRAQRYEDAVPHYRRLAEVTPCDAENLSRLAETLSRLGRPVEAEEHLGGVAGPGSIAEAASGQPLELCRVPSDGRRG